MNKTKIIKADEKFDKAVKDAREYGILDEYKEKHIRIRNYYISLRLDEDKNYDEAVIIISEKFCLSHSSIKNIIIGCNINEIKRLKRDSS